MISKENHPFVEPFYTISHGIGCKIEILDKTYDDRYLKRDLKIVGPVRSGYVQEKTHDPDKLAFLTTTISEPELLHCKAEIICGAYMNETLDGVDACIMVDVPELIEYLKGHNDSMFLPDGTLKPFHPWLNGDKNFASIPLVYLLRYDKDRNDPMHNIVIGCWLSGRALRVLTWQFNHRRYGNPNIAVKCDLWSEA